MGLTMHGARRVLAGLQILLAELFAKRRML
jgi:hypothetical protein